MIFIFPSSSFSIINSDSCTVLAVFGLADTVEYSCLLFLPKYLGDSKEISSRGSFNPEGNVISDASNGTLLNI